MAWGGMLLDWLGLLVRWTHVVAGIAWIGASFYFIALDAGLKPNPRLDARVKGEAWQVHGGGFYQIQKYQVAPDFLPADLTWFKWEAYATWIFGFILLVLIYYLHPNLYLIDRHVLDLKPVEAVSIGAGSLAAGWAIYDSLCRSRLGRDSRALAITGFALLVLAIVGYTHVFSGRGAFIEVGALVGSIMVGNVFFIIIPNQKIVVADLLAGRTPDPALGAQAGQRSLHNNYLTLPVVFTMIGNHYAFTYGTRWNWLILTAVFVAGFLVRHWFNLRHADAAAPWWLWPAAGVPILVAALPAVLSAVPPGSNVPVTFAQVQAIIAQRCQACHSAQPRFPGIAAPPAGVMFDTPREIAAQAPLIQAMAVATHTMPLNNVTRITTAERATLGAWIAAGARR
ncbi:MAG TPA: urate hydroxylase PuuD [Acetobacteraceae bacterium]|nr:urate hydroxylase PuuD [Acetobacteraceae bacterium]